MSSVVQVLAFGAGTLLLGVALTLGTLFALVGRHSEPDNVESCLSTFIVLTVLAAAIYFLVLAARV